MSNSRPNRRQLRRHARKLRREGFEPMMVVNPGDPLPETAAAEIGRWLWRYRSELAPIVLGALTALLALGLHNTHPSPWPWLATATLAATVAFTVPAPHWARKAWSLLDRPAERIYIAALALVAGGWLTTATALGPTTTPMPIVGAVLTLLCGIPWWVSRRRRAKVSLDRKASATPT